MAPATILKSWLVAIPLPKRATRSVENGVTIAPEMRAMIYDQTGSVVSPWSTLIRPTWHPEGKRQACAIEATTNLSSPHQRRMQGPTKLCTTTRGPLHISAWQPNGDRVASFRVHV